MPFKSRAQQKYMYANLPHLAKKWQREYGSPPKARKIRKKRDA